MTKAKVETEFKQGSLTEKMVALLSKDKTTKFTYTELSRKLKVNTGALGFAVKQLSQKKGYAMMAKRVVKAKA